MFTFVRHALLVVLRIPDKRRMNLRDLPNTFSLVGSRVHLPDDHLGGSDILECDCELFPDRLQLFAFSACGRIVMHEDIFGLVTYDASM